MVELENEYEIKSNRESGFGRYDIMIIPKDTDRTTANCKAIYNRI
jgi:hypothetical protein